MIREELTDGPSARRAVTGAARMLLALKLDGPLLVGLGLIAAYGLVVLYSASGQSLGTVIRQIGHLGMGTIAMAVGEETETLEEVHEPFLIQEGYLQRTPQGRVLTPKGYTAIALTPPRSSQGDLL